MLSDPSKRRLYDEARRRDASEATRGGGGGDYARVSPGTFWDARRKARASTSRGDFSEETLGATRGTAATRSMPRGGGASAREEPTARRTRAARRRRAAGNGADRFSRSSAGVGDGRGAHRADAAMVLAYGAFVAGRGRARVSARPAARTRKGLNRDEAFFSAMPARMDATTTTTTRATDTVSGGFAGGGFAGVHARGGGWRAARERGEGGWRRERAATRGEEAI